MTGRLDTVAAHIRRASGAPAVMVAWRDRDGTVTAGGDAPDSMAAADGAFLIASVTKKFVAASVLKLCESGRLDLDQRLIDLARPADTAALRAGGHDPAAVSIDDLLRHTSGLADHAADPAYLQAVLDQPARRWSRAEQVRWAAGLGPVGPPGGQVVYSDTGYVLLGGVIESITGLGLAAAVRYLIGFERLGLASTWWESLEPGPPGVALLTQWIADREVGSLDASCDLFGGGGLTATAGDLAAFMGLLMSGHVVSRTSLQQMCQETVLPGTTGFGRGVFRLPGPDGVWWGHTGFWGVAAGGAADGRGFSVCIAERDAAAGHLALAVEHLVGAALPRPDRAAGIGRARRRQLTQSVVLPPS